MKNQSFYIFHFKSKRILRSDYSIDLDIKQARKNGEVVSLGENQVIRSLFDMKNRRYNIEEIDRLLSEKRKLKNKKSTSSTISRILDIENRLNEILFVPEIISVVIEDKRDHKKLIQHSFNVNGNKFVRLMCGAGHSRRNTVIFCDERIEKQLKSILQNGIDKSVPISYNKYNAYFALSFSGTTKVSDPYFTVIPDYITIRDEKVDFVTETPDGEDDQIDEIIMPIEFNAFDGEGIISLEQATRWSKELELDYIPSTFIVRNAFMKGMVCVMDFHKYSDEIGEHIIKDVYGNDVNIRDMDLILTKSMFKGFSFYSSLQDYQKQCRENKMAWGVSRYSPKKNYEYTFSNYQFIQALNLNTEKITNICDDTLDYFSKTILGENGDISYALLYLLGNMIYESAEDFSFDKIVDPITKSLILNNNLLKDPYIQNHISHSLNRKIKDSYIGNLLLKGNYMPIIADPFALMEWAFGKEPKGLLKRNEHYCDFWNKKNVKTVVAMRSPLTWRSECNPLHLQNEIIHNEWYKYLGNGVVYNIFGIDNMLQADSDQDGDLVMTTDNFNIVSSVYGGLPITYEKGKGEKNQIIESELYLSDIRSFDSPIGFITNVSTTMNADIEYYLPGSKEYEERIKRLKLCRFYQGQAIDAAKNTHVKKMPNHWTKWTNTKNINGALLNKIAFDNLMVVDRRPYFMKHLYPRLNKKYKNFYKKYEAKSLDRTGRPLQEVLDIYITNPRLLSKKEKSFAFSYYKFSPLVETNCIMNKLCWYMESKIKEINMSSRNLKKECDFSLLIDNDIPLDKAKLAQMLELYQSYKIDKRNFAYIKDFDGREMFSTLEQYNKYILNESYKISSNICELANMAVKICYEDKPNDNKNFLWHIFGEGVVLNVMKNRQENIFVPLISKNGNIEYMGEKFENQTIDILEESQYGDL